MSEEPTTTTSPRIEVLGLRREGLRVRVACPDCGAEAERFQGSLGGLALGFEICSGCGAEVVVDPCAVGRALAERWPLCSAEEAARRNERLTALAEIWHRLEPWRSALVHAGIELGPATEREISHHLTAFLELEGGPGKAR